MISEFSKMTGLPQVEGLKPTIIVDSSEQTPLVFQNFPTITCGLVTGDYSVAGLENDFCVEHKSHSDLYGSLTSGRDRFMREIERMKIYQFKESFSSDTNIHRCPVTALFSSPRKIRYYMLPFKAV